MHAHWYLVPLAALGVVGHAGKPLVARAPAKLDLTVAFLFVEAIGVRLPDARVPQSDAPRRLPDAPRLSRHPVRVARSERVLPWCEFGQPGGRHRAGGGGSSSGAAAVWHAVFWGGGEA